MKKLLLFILSIPLILHTNAQVRTAVSGLVTDSQTGEPLAGATITLSNSRNGTSTDSGGHYSITNIPTGHNVFEVSFLGYKTIVRHVDLKGVDTFNFSLVSSILVNEGITVTAVAGASSIRKSPIPVTRVNKGELLLTPSTNIIDALTRQPGVSQLSTGPAISKPVIRGLGYNRLVVVNDGIRQEGQQWGDEHGIEIDENSVSRVEIVKGPASLIYGSDAMAGVINIITTTPVPNNTIRGNILTSYQTNNHQRSFFASLGGNTDGFNWNAWADYTAAADYRNKYERVFNSKFNNKNFGGYVGYNGRWGFSHLIISNFNQRLGVVEGERNTNGQLTRIMPGGLEGLPSESDFNSTDPLVPYQSVQHFKIISDNSFKAGSGRISVNLGWQHNQRREFGDPDASTTPGLHFDLTTFNFSGAYHFDDKNGWNTAIGVSGMRQQNLNKAEEVLIPEYTLLDAGAFLFTQKTIGRTTLTGGIRFDNRWLEGEGLEENGNLKFAPFKKQFGNFSASAGLSYEASDRLVWKLNLARGFRAPSIPELATNGAHEGTNRYEYGSTDLKSETSWQADLGLELNSDHVMVNATTFYNYIQNFIFYSKLQATNGTDSLVDVAGTPTPAFKFSQHTAALYGAELVIDLHPHPLDWLHWENTLSYVRGTFSDPIEGVTNVPFIPAAHWISELRGDFYKKGKHIRNLSVHLELDHTFTQNQAFTAFDTETGTPGYSLLNASISTDFVYRNKPLFSLYFMGSNLADVAYQSHLSRLKYAAIDPVSGRQGVFNTGRNFTIKLSVPLNLK